MEECKCVRLCVWWWAQTIETKSSEIHGICLASTLQHHLHITIEQIFTKHILIAHFLLLICTFIFCFFSSCVSCVCESPFLFREAVFIRSFLLCFHLFIYCVIHGDFRRCHCCLWNVSSFFVFAFLLIFADNYVVAWKRGIAILSAGSVKVTPDPRVHLVNGYSLQIKNAVPQDAGDYVCQIATLEPREITHTVEILGKFTHYITIQFKAFSRL